MKEGLLFCLDRVTFSKEVLNPGQPLAFDPDRWRDALVLVQSGVLQMRCRSGQATSFDAGCVVHFANLDLDSLSAGGEEPTHLLAVCRPTASESPDTCRCR